MTFNVELAWALGVQQAPSTFCRSASAVPRSHRALLAYSGSQRAFGRAGIGAASSGRGLKSFLGAVLVGMRRDENIATHRRHRGIAAVKRGDDGST